LLIPTADGSRWLTTDIQPDGNPWKVAAARNGDIVLVNVGSESQRYDLQSID